MRFVRYQESGDPNIRYGWIYGDLVGEIEGDIFGEFRRLEASLPLFTVRLLPPIVPGKIVAVEWNYLDQTREFNRTISDFPSIFFKPTSAVIGMNDPIILPVVSKQIEQECELAVIIGKKATVSRMKRNGHVTLKKFPIIRSVAHAACNSERQSNT